MTSIIIAAHNEGAVIGRTLDALLEDPTDAQVIVVPNGCTDDTAAVARARGVKVVELEQGSKPIALNAGDAAADSYPRIYLDADILVPVGTIAALIDALREPGIYAAVPARDLNTRGRPWPVRAYSGIHRRLPIFRDGLFGRGLIALSYEGRARFTTFPVMVADDLFIDSLYAPHEKAHVDTVTVVVDTPSTTGDLIRRLIRVRRGSAAMRLASEKGDVQHPVRPADRWSWLRDVVAKEPRLAFAGVVYAAITTYAALRARQGPVGTMDWGRRESTKSRRDGS